VQFPPFQLPYLGNGLLIGTNAVLHVLVSHGFAIGGVAMVVLAEIVAWRRSAPHWRQFAKDLLKFLIIVITGVGAVTGVGIWFITSVIAPRAIGSLLRVFFWPWLLEWIVFTLEVIALLIYYFAWDRMEARSRRAHIGLGIGYVLLGFASAAIITGILGFMLTPGTWPAERTLWSGFLNPTYLPQLLVRLALALHLGALVAVVALLLGSREQALQQEGLPIFGGIYLGTLPVVVLTLWWYFSRVPDVYRVQAIGAALPHPLSQISSVFWIAAVIGLLVLVAFGAASLGRRVAMARFLVLPVYLVAITMVGTFERVREFIRGPYLMPGYMYVNQVLLTERPFLHTSGMLPNSYWYLATNPAGDVTKAGAFLFAQNCAACHTLDGINGMRQRAAGRSEDGLYVIIAHTHEMMPFMTPFSGTDDERRILANFLYRLASGEIEMTSAARLMPDGRTRARAQRTAGAWEAPPLASPDTR